MKAALKNIIQNGFFVILILVSGFFISHVGIAVKGALFPAQTASLPLTKYTQQNASVLGDRTKDTLSIGFVGDIAPAHPENETSLSGFFSRVSEPLSSVDIMIGNLEGTFSTEGTPKCGEENPGCYLFSGSEEFLNEISTSGFDVLSLANNHAYDYGAEGYQKTQELISQKNVLAVGQKNSINYKDTPHGKVAFVGASSYFWSPSLVDVNELIEHIHAARKNAEIVVVVFHGGAEGREFTQTPDEEEWYMGENRGDVRMMARRAIDEGADLILGSGPHVLRGMEIYKQRLIAYSLGNFAFSGTKTLSQKDILGVSAILHAELYPDGEFKKGSLVPIQINAQGKPEIDNEKKAFEIIRTLSFEDFSYTGVHIDDNGEIFIPAN